MTGICLWHLGFNNIKFKSFFSQTKSCWSKQAQNDIHALVRVHACAILQVHLSRENFICLNDKNVLHPKIADMVWSFKSQDENNYNLLLRSNLCKFKDIFQYVYSIVYSDIYWSTERRGFDLKSLFQLLFKVYKDKEKAELGKDPSSYKDKN